MARKTSKKIELSLEERLELERWQRSTTVKSSLAKRGRVILMMADGNSITAISKAVVMDRRHIYKWVGRFESSGIDGLYDKPRSGRPPFFHHKSQ